MVLQASPVANDIAVSKCERPAFADFAVPKYVTKEDLGNEDFQLLRGAKKLCVFAVVWFRERIDVGGKLEIYTATYEPGSQRKAGELYYEIKIENIWNRPTIKIHTRPYEVKAGSTAFALEVQTSYLAGTFGEDNDFLNLLLMKFDGKLENILSVQILHSFNYRFCKPQECEGDNSKSIRNIVLDKKATNGYKNLIVTTTERIFSPNKKRKQRVKILPPITHRWDGNKYNSPQ